MCNIATEKALRWADILSSTPHDLHNDKGIGSGRFDHGDFATPRALFHQRNVLGTHAEQRVGGDWAMQCKVCIFYAKYACSPRVTCATSYYINSNKLNLNLISLSTKLNRSITKRPQHCIYARLIASPLGLEPFEHILIHSQRNGCFGRQRLHAFANQPTNNVFDVGLWMFWCRLRVASTGAQASPISFGFH